MNRKALSPLISTFILISFAVCLGIIIMSWGKNVTAEVHTTCNDADITIVKMNGNDMICSDKHVLSFTLSNLGPQIYGYKIVIIGETQVYEKVIEKKLASGSVLIETIKYDNVQNIQKVHIIPLTGDATCTRQTAEYEQIGACT